MSARIAVIYYSSTGHVHQMATALAAGAEETGAEVRLRRAAELAPREAIESNDAWREHLEATKDVEEASIDDLDWATGYAFGTPTRFGLPTAQLKQVMDQAGPLWAAGKLANKTATAFTSSQTEHGGQESTLLAIQNVFYHWGAIIVPPGYTHESTFAGGGNPYGASFVSGGADGTVSDEVLAVARYQGRRLAEIADKLA